MIFRLQTYPSFTATYGESCVTLPILPYSLGISETIQYIMTCHISTVCTASQLGLDFNEGQLGR